MAAKRTLAPPTLNPAYAALTLADLRDLRRELGGEESRVSYWRRIIQARIDLLTRGGRDGDLVQRLSAVLAESGNVHRRLASLSVNPEHEIEALPDLGHLWSRVVDPSDTTAVEAFVGELQVVEAQLSSLRSEIHQRLDEATGQLIARYRAEPSLALSALPDIELGEDIP
jgi:hypothetical protein